MCIFVYDFLFPFESKSQGEGDTTVSASGCGWSKQNAPDMYVVDGIFDIGQKIYQRMYNINSLEHS